MKEISLYITNESNACILSVPGGTLLMGATSKLWKKIKVVT
jgi:hypothetical protein